MKALVCVALSVFACLALVAVMKIRQIEIEKLEKRSQFDEIKIRVTNDMWTDLQLQLKTDDASFKEREDLLKQQKTKSALVSDEVQSVQKKAEECAVSKQVLQSELDEARETLANMKDEYDKEKSDWESEKAELQKELSETSPVCDHLKPGSEAIRNLCGDKVVGEIPKKIEPKAEDPKPEEPKAEQPQETL